MLTHILNQGKNSPKAHYVYVNLFSILRKNAFQQHSNYQGAYVCRYYEENKNLSEYQ